MAEGDVIPLRRGELLLRHLRAAEGEGGLVLPTHNPVDVAVRDQHVERGAALGAQRRPLSRRQRLVRDGEHAAVQLGKHQAARRVDDDLDAQRLVQFENRPGLERARRIVRPREEHDGRLRQPHAQPLQLLKQEQDRRIGRPHRVEHVAGDDDQVRPLRQQVVHRAPECLGDVGLALVAPARRLPVELPEAEVEVREVGELHDPPTRRIVM